MFDIRQKVLVIKKIQGEIAYAIHYNRTGFDTFETVDDAFFFVQFRIPSRFYPHLAVFKDGRPFEDINDETVRKYSG